MIGMAIGAGMQVIGSVMNNIATAKARRDTLAAYNKQIANLNTEINADPTKRADTNRLLTKTDENYKEHRQQAIQRENLGFQPHDATVAQAEADAKAKADTIGNIYAQNEQRKDALKQQRNQLELQKDTYAAQNDTTNAANLIMSNAGNIAGAFDTGLSKSSQSNSQSNSQTASQKV